MLVSELNSWGRCKECGEVLWCEISPHDQACGCSCGGLHLCNDHCHEDVGLDDTFTEEAMQIILDEEYNQ